MAAKEDELAGRESSAAPTCGPLFFISFYYALKIIFYIKNLRSSNAYLGT
jgi:hypothetical protein